MRKNVQRGVGGKWEWEEKGLVSGKDEWVAELSR